MLTRVDRRVGEGLAHVRVGLRPLTSLGGDLAGALLQNGPVAIAERDDLGSWIGSEAADVRVAPARGCRCSTRRSCRSPANALLSAISPVAATAAADVPRNCLRDISVIACSPSRYMTSLGPHTASGPRNYSARTHRIPCEQHTWDLGQYIGRMYLCVIVGGGWN